MEGGAVNLTHIASRLNAARDRRQAMMRAAMCIDTQSEPGSWQAVLDSGAHSITVLPDADAWWEQRHERREARRKSAAVRAAKAGHSTRWAKAGKQARAMFPCAS
jgi:hypothetical protein